jgi:hypothetical protein
MNRRVSAWLTGILGIGAVLTVSAAILRAVMEVRHNRGAETFVNAHGMQVHWVDDLTMWTAAFLAILIILGATAIYGWRRKRDLALVRKLEARISAEPSVRDK